MIKSSTPHLPLILLLLLLQTLGLNPEMVGVVFMIPSLLYSIMAVMADRIVLGLGHKKVREMMAHP